MEKKASGQKWSENNNFTTDLKYEKNYRNFAFLLLILSFMKLFKLLHILILDIDSTLIFVNFSLFVNHAGGIFSRTQYRASCGYVNKISRFNPYNLGI